MAKKIDIKIKDIIIDMDALKILCGTSKPNCYVNIIHYGEGFNIDWQDNDSLTIVLEIEKGLVTPTKECFFYQ